MLLFLRKFMWHFDGDTKPQHFDRLTQHPEVLHQVLLDSQGNGYLFTQLLWPRQNPREFPFPQYVYASIVMGEQLMKNNSHPWHPSPCHNYTAYLELLGEEQTTRAVYLFSHITRTFLLQTQHGSLLSRRLSLQVISGISYHFYFIVFQRCLGLSGPC